MENEFDLNLISGYDIKENLTLDNVEEFMRTLGVTRIIRCQDHLIMPTICHNPIDDETASMKLYYYQKDKQFFCYTSDCGSMTIFQLYQHYMENNFHPVSFEEAKQYIVNFLKKDLKIKSCSPTELIPYIIDKTKYSFERATIKLDSYNPNVLDCFVKYYHSSWLRENISKTTMDKFHILFSLSQNKIVIPQFDIKGRLIGIRARSLNVEEVENGRKYMPIMIGDVEYRHQTGFTLYGIYEHQEAIRQFKRAIIFEAEKSCLKHDSYYGEDSVAVALCGSNINKYQINLLTNILGVNEIIIALDSEKNKVGWRDKIIKICDKYKNSANFSYVYDDFNLLKDKDAPIDRGKETWEKLYNKRYGRK